MAARAAGGPEPRPGAATRARLAWAQARALAEEALARPPETRAAFIEAACGTDPSLRTEVEAQLAACEQVERSTGFLEGSAASFAAPLLQAMARHDGGEIERRPALAGGEVLDGRYALEREIGRGGAAIVYLARDLLHGRRVAIKVLDPALGAMMSTERFLREIRVTAGFTHPHILPLHDSGEVGGLLYYVMPFVEGETLRERLARDGPLPPGEVLRLLREVASALGYAHRRGIVHRDIKPANILLADGHAVVADFGIARAVHRARESDTLEALPAAPGPPGAVSARLTGVGISPGTPAYMAPEQARGSAEMDHRVDLYSLGVVAYEALAGVHPFGARVTVPPQGADWRQEAAPLADRRPDAPPALAALVHQLLATDPADRPTSAEELLRSLDGFTTPRAGDHPPAAIAPTRQSGRDPVRLRRRRVFLAAILLVLLAASGYALRSWVEGGGMAGAVADGRAHAGDGGTRGGAEPIHTLAVLPFENVGGSADDEYFSDGMTDELAHALSRLPQLRLAGRTSSYAYRKTGARVQEIGAALGVAALVNGTVRRSNGRIRVTTQLVGTTDGTVLWDGIFESATGDMFTVQDELTRAIMTALAPSLGQRAELEAGRGRGTADPEAYELYLKGHYFFLIRGADNLEQAIGYLERAVVRDPGFARAHAGLALAYYVLPVYAPGAVVPVVERMEVSARRAMALDSTLADARLAMAAALDARLRLREALPHYRAATLLDPASATAHHWYGMALLTRGRNGEALAELNRATQLDPLAVSAASGVATAYLFARRYQEALAAANHAYTLDSANPVAILVKGEAQAFAGEPESAVQTLERGLRLYPGDTRMMAELVYVYAAAGHWDDAARLREKLHGGSIALLDGTERAFADMVFGDPEPLARLLSSASGAQRYQMAGGALGCNPLLDPLWESARFREAMRRLTIERCPEGAGWRLPPRRSG